MATPLNIIEIYDVDIDTTRGAGTEDWIFYFTSVTGGINYGNIYDNTNTWIDNASGTGDLKIDVTGNDEDPAIQDLDFLTVWVDNGVEIYSLKIWLPALATDDTLYVDTDGCTWYDSALTQPAGGVAVVAESVTIVEDTSPTHLLFTTSVEDTVIITEEGVDGAVPVSDTVVITEDVRVQIGSWNEEDDLEVNTNWSKDV